jgi:hypothetical protein
LHWHSHRITSPAFYTKPPDANSESKKVYQWFSWPNPVFEYISSHSKSTKPWQFRIRKFRDPDSDIKPSSGRSLRKFVSGCLGFPTNKRCHDCVLSRAVVSFVLLSPLVRGLRS